MDNLLLNCQCAGVCFSNYHGDSGVKSFNFKIENNERATNGVSEASGQKI